jgi:phage terminase large subunit-like protein
VSAEGVIRWIESVCRVPSGRHVGEPLRLLPYQIEIIERIYGTPTRRAIISMGRQNGKTLFSACMTLVHLVGPRFQPNGLCVSTALGRDQAALLFDYCAKMVRASPELSATVAVIDHLKQLKCPELGTIYKALSSDAPSQLGMAPFFIVHDELGQVKDATSPLYDAVESGGVAQVAPLSVIISTQAADDLALLSRLIDGAIDDPLTKVFLWSAPDDLDPFSDEALRAANPGFDSFQNQGELRTQARTAKRMPSMEASYRNLHLNQRIETSTQFVSPSVWAANAAPPSKLERRNLWGALDLGTSHDLCAFVLVDEQDGSVHPFCWLPEEGLAEKSRADHAPYTEWAKSGHLLTTPGSATSFEYVAQFLRGIFSRCNVKGIAFDRALMAHFKPWLIKAGFTESEIEAKFIPFGQGYFSMTPAIRELETRLLAGKLRHGDHPVLKMCAVNAKVDTDSSGGRKFVKKKSRGRMDAIVALAMACAVAPLVEQKPEPDYRVFFVGDHQGPERGWRRIG